MNKNMNYNPLKSVKENPVARDCKQLLKINGIEHWRVNVLHGKFQGFKEKTWRVIKTGIKGHSDMVFPLHDGSGKTCYIETKRPVGGVQSQDQKDFEAMCIKWDMPYYIVSSWLDLAEILEIYGMLKIKIK